VIWSRRQRKTPSLLDPTWDPSTYSRYSAALRGHGRRRLSFRCQCLADVGISRRTISKAKLGKQTRAATPFLSKRWFQFDDASVIKSLLSGMRVLIGLVQALLEQLRDFAAGHDSRGFCVQAGSQGVPRQDAIAHGSSCQQAAFPERRAEELHRRGTNDLEPPCAADEEVRAGSKPTSVR